MFHVPYASVIGSLMYAIVCTISNRAQAVNVESRYMGNPRKKHWQAMKRIFRYHKGKIDIGLVYHGDMSCALVGYSDSDYATNLDAKRYVIRYAFMIHNSLSSWKATLQPTMVLCTIEVEYIALVEATKEGIWLKGLISNLGFPHEKTIILCDNRSAKYLANDQLHHETTKHIDIKYHFIHSEKRFKVQKVDLMENPADMFTKPIPRSKFMHCLDLLNIDC